MKIIVTNNNKLENIEDLPNGTAFVFSGVNTHFCIKVGDNQFLTIRANGKIDELNTIIPTGHGFAKWYKVVRATIKSVELEIK